MKLLVIGDFHGNFPEKLKRKIKREKIDLVIGLGDYSGIPEWKPMVMKRLKAAKEGREIPSPEEIIGKKEFKKLLKKDFELGKNVLYNLDKIGKGFYIFGNGDDEWYKYPFDKKVDSVKKININFLKKLKNLKNINYKKTKFKGLEIIGFGGYMDIDAVFDKKEFKGAENKEQLKGRIRRREKAKERFFNLLKNIKDKKIFVLHYSPKGFFDIIKDIKSNPMNGKSAGINFFTEAIKKYKPLLVVCGHMHEYQGKKKLGKTIIINPGSAFEGKAAIINLDERKGKIKSIKFLK